MLHRNALVIASLAVPLILLSGCTPPAPTPTSPPVATDEPSAPVENPLPEDALLEVTATATADNGAALSLRSVVHKSLAWDDPAAASLADLMSQVCDGSLENSVYDDQLWSFTKIDIFATPVDGTPAWPGDRPVHLLPYAGTDAIAADAIVVDDENVDIATPFCVRDKYLFGAGEGTIVLGLAGDTDEVTAAGNFTRWANTSYGFSVGEAQQSAADIGVTITDCTYAVSLLGKEFGGQNESWEFGGSDSYCSVGVPFTGAN
jgi:hypothetical protein